MCEVIEIEGKNEQEINENITKELNLSKNDVVIIDSVEKSSLFKGKKIISKVIKKEDIKNYIKSFFSTLAKSFNISINCEIKNEENEFNILLISDNNAILIGKAGKNLNAIQVILRTIIKRMTNNKVKINIDASNYKELFKLKIDYIIDCCDTVSTKILLINECLNRNIKIFPMPPDKVQIF